MGDAGFLRHHRVEVRRHNPVGDTLYINGQVVWRVEKDGVPCVEVTQRAVNQNGELSAVAEATIQLPSRQQPA